MLVNKSYRQKESSPNLVGADHPELTPLERGKSLVEGGSPQVVGGHLTPPEVQDLGVKLTSGRRSSGDRAFIPLVGGGQEETTGGEVVKIKQGGLKWTRIGINLNQ